MHAGPEGVVYVDMLGGVGGHGKRICLLVKFSMAGVLMAVQIWALRG